MNTQSTHNKLSFASTFLSHSSADKRLVEAVAKELCRRGVLCWLDKNELSHGSLDAQLKQAVERQTIMTLFISEAFLASDWCKDELRWAIEAKEGVEHLFPVYLGDPLVLVKNHKLLNTRFLNADRDQVNHLGFYDRNAPMDPNPTVIAEQIADAVYRHTIPQNCTDIAIFLDQRGSGSRRGEPALPTNIPSLAIPLLTFRPDIEQRQQHEILTGDDWSDMANSMTSALSAALGTVRNETVKVRVLGHAQTGLMWAIGRHFNRTTSAELYAYGRNNAMVTNKKQGRLTPLTKGNPNCATLITGTLPARKIALGIGISENYKQAVQQAFMDIPFMWIEKGLIMDDDAMEFVVDVVATISHLRTTHGVNEVMLFWTTANHVALLAAANLTSHVIPALQFMEWDHVRAQYVHLPMPNI